MKIELAMPSIQQLTKIHFRVTLVADIVGRDRLLRACAKITSQNEFANLTEKDLTNAQFPMLNSHPKDA
jgi:hypothetical protein